MMASKYVTAVIGVLVAIIVTAVVLVPVVDEATVSEKQVTETVTFGSNEVETTNVEFSATRGNTTVISSTTSSFSEDSNGNAIRFPYELLEADSSINLYATNRNQVFISTLDDPDVYIKASTNSEEFGLDVSYLAYTSDPAVYKINVNGGVPGASIIIPRQAIVNLTLENTVPAGAQKYVQVYSWNTITVSGDSSVISYSVNLTSGTVEGVLDHDNYYFGSGTMGLYWNDDGGYWSADEAGLQKFVDGSGLYLADGTHFTQVIFALNTNGNYFLATSAPVYAATPQVGGGFYVSEGSHETQTDYVNPKYTAYTYGPLKDTSRAVYSDLGGYQLLAPITLSAAPKLIQSSDYSTEVVYSSVRGSISDGVFMEDESGDMIRIPPQLTDGHTYDVAAGELCYAVNGSDVISVAAPSTDGLPEGFTFDFTENATDSNVYSLSISECPPEGYVVIPYEVQYEQTKTVVEKVNPLLDVVPLMVILAIVVGAAAMIVIDRRDYRCRSRAWNGSTP